MNLELEHSCDGVMYPTEKNIHSWKEVTAISWGKLLDIEIAGFVVIFFLIYQRTINRTNMQVPICADSCVLRRMLSVKHEPKAIASCCDK